MTLADHRLPTTNPPPPAGYLRLHEAIQATQRFQPLYNALAQLPPRQRVVIELRFGLSGGKALTLEATAHELGTTKQSVKLRQEAALKRLRPLVDPHLEDMAA